MNNFKKIVTLEDVYAAIGFPDIYSISDKEARDDVEAQAHKRLVELLQALTHMSVIDRYYENNLDEIENEDSSEPDVINPVDLNIETLVWDEAVYSDYDGKASPRSVSCYITVSAGLLVQYLGPHAWKEIKESPEYARSPIVSAEICVDMMEGAESPDDISVVISPTDEDGSDYCWEYFPLDDGKRKELFDYCKRHLDAENNTEHDDSHDSLLDEYGISAETNRIKPADLSWNGYGVNNNLNTYMCYVDLPLKYSCLMRDEKRGEVTKAIAEGVLEPKIIEVLVKIPMGTELKLNSDVSKVEYDISVINTEDRARFISTPVLSDAEKVALYNYCIRKLDGSYKTAYIKENVVFQSYRYCEDYIYCKLQCPKEFLAKHISTTWVENYYTTYEQADCSMLEIHFPKSNASRMDNLCVSIIPYKDEAPFAGVFNANFDEKQRHDLLDVCEENIKLQQQLIEDVKYSLFGESGEGETNSLGFKFEGHFSKWLNDNMFEFASGEKVYRLSVNRIK